MMFSARRSNSSWEEVRRVLTISSGGTPLSDKNRRTADSRKLYQRLGQENSTESRADKGCSGRNNLPQRAEQ